MKCHLVLDINSRGWIIEKMCRRLADELYSLGCNVSIGDSARGDADVNHFTLFWWMPSDAPRQSTVAITHIDDTHRLKLARAAIDVAELAICMSSMTMKQLVNDGNDRKKLCYVQPALDDGLVPRRIVIGIASKVYPDGRKREGLLERLAKDMDLPAFHFEIFGTGWDRPADALRRAGALVSITENSDNPDHDYQRLRLRIPFFDYYLYLGLDEGSLGTLDALAAGVSTIVTPQGFHVDLPHGITHPFWDYKGLRKIFDKIQEERNLRVRAVQSLTWRTYAEKHLLIWHQLLAGRAAELPRLLGQETLGPIGGCADEMERYLAQERRKLLFRAMRRFHLPWLKSLAGARVRKYLPKAISRRLLHS
jgi:hypothetical protein